MTYCMIWYWLIEWTYRQCDWFIEWIYR